jgi:hypothetical protein
LAIRANRPLFRLSTRRFKIAEPAATGQVRRAIPQSRSKKHAYPGGTSREEQAMKTVRFRQRQMSVGKDGRTVLPLAKKS